MDPGLRGLVCLTPDTVAAMNAGLKPLVSGGGNLGVLTDAGGSPGRSVGSQSARRSLGALFWRPWALLP